MLSLNDHINSLNFSTQLEEVKNLINSAQPKTTFWANRLIEVTGFTGSVYLDDFARKVNLSSNQRVEADDLTTAERIAGIEIVKKINNLYQQTDTLIQNSNFFTRFINWISESLPYTPRFFISDTEMHFRGYSKTKFVQAFGGTISDMRRHPQSAGWFETSSGKRIIAKEKALLTD